MGHRRIAQQPGLPPELLLDPDRLAELVPAGVLRALAVEPTAALVAPVGDGALRMILFWSRMAAPVDVTSTMQSEALRQFAALAPLLDAQVRARESATRLRAVVSALDQAVVVTVAGDVMANVNAAAARLLGLEPGSVDGSTLATAMRALRERAVDPDTLGVEVSRLRRSPTEVAHDWVWHLHGSPSHLRVTSVPVDTTTEQGRVWVFDDISTEMELLESEQRANQALEGSEERYRLLAENVSDVVMLGDPDGTITWVSPSITAALGWAPEDLIGRHGIDSVRPENADAFDALQAQVMRGEIVEFEAPMRTAGGPDRWMHVRAKPVLGDDGRVVGRVVGLWDVQASHEAKEQLERQEQRANRALADSEERYRLLAENVSDVVVLTTVEGVLTWVSPSVTAVLGWAPDDLVGRTAQHIVDADQWEANLRKRERLLDGERVEYEMPMRTARGDHRWMNIRATVFSDEHGDPAGFLAGWWDVQAAHDTREEFERSERRSAQALAESEHRYRLLAENVSDVVMLGEPDGTLTWVSPSVTTALGWAPEDLVGRRASDFMRAESIGQLRAMQEQVLRGEVAEFEASMRTAAGTDRWMEVRAKPVLDDDGRVVGRVLGLWDVQAAHEAREELQRQEQRADRERAESEERYRLLAENVSDVAVLFDLHGVVTWVSSSITTVLGWTPDDLAGRTTQRLVNPDHWDLAAAAREPLLRGERVDYEVQMRTAAGDYRWIEIRVTPLRDEEGNVAGLLAAWWDNQATHDAKEELERSERRSAQALAKSEQRYRLLAENMSDVVIMGDTDGTPTWVSPSVTATLGWAPEDLVGHSVLEFVRPDHLEVLQRAIELVEGGEHAKFEAPIRTADGAYRWMELRGRLLVDDDGRVVGRVAALWDVHESHEAKEQLAHSQRRYQLLLDNTTEVVFQTVDGVVTWVSPAVEGVTGWTAADVVGTSSRQLWHPDDWDRASWAHDDARDGVPTREVLRLVTPDGSHRWMEVVLRPYVEADGRPGTVGMLYDISDRVLAQQAAQQSEERYRTVAENASDVVCRYGFDGTIEWVFGSTEAFLGHSAAELVGSSLEDHFMVEDWGDREDIRARLGRGEAVELLARVRRSDGVTRWVELRAKAALQPDGSPGSIIGTMRDAQAEFEYREALGASERQARDLVDAFEAARDEAVRASTAKTAFLSRMSHELRTPLNAVLGFAQLLALDPLSPEQAEAVHHIRTGGRHLLDLINEIVDISRIEAGRLSLSMETVDSVAVLAEAVELVRPLEQQHGVLVEAAGADRVPDVHADRQRTTQVLLNLVSNAVKYNRPGGSVRVECRAGGPGEVAFEVSDTGPGIPQELLPRLFEPFDRLGAENSDVEGTGIGLALADALARAMGGRIEVATEVGAGSTFTLVLSAAPSDAVLSGPAPRGPDSYPDSRLRILYVEDNPTNATLMARVVALRPGSRLEVAVDGSRGIAAALIEPPDLVFLDLHLPDMPGEAVLEQLRLLPGLAEVPVVVVTADASPSVRERLSALGSDGFLTKPITLDDVLGWIDATASAVRG